jgi:hypothetical protein
MPPSTVHLERDTLLLPLRSGDTVVLIGRPFAEEDRVTYTGVGRLPGLPFYGVAVSYYENREYLLIHDSTGGQTSLDAAPVVSPDAKRLAVASLDLYGISGANALTILDVEPYGARIAWQLTPERWGPEAPEWHGEDTLVFFRRWPESSSHQGEATLARLIHGPSGWVIDTVTP